MNTPHNKIQELSWEETSFWSKITLVFLSWRQERVKIKSNDLMVRAEGYSALSSTYYSIVGTGVAQLRASTPLWLGPFKVGLWVITWLPLVVWCYIWMKPLSDMVLNAITYDAMTVSQCDVRGAILRRMRHYDEAEECLNIGLCKITLGDPVHIRGLLHVGLADVYFHLGLNNLAHREVFRALECARVAKSSDPKQASRIYRQSFELCGRLGLPLGRNFLQDYKHVLAMACSADQELKAQTGLK